VAEILQRVLLSAATAPIRFYQRFVSPYLPRRCKYEPTCSAYAIAAVRSHGIMRGTVLAAWRILRCNPFSHGGYDPIEAQTLFCETAGTSAPPASASRPTEARQPRMLA
jgi:putative membrane protein insertion efficiency factor